MGAGASSVEHGALSKKLEPLGYSEQHMQWSHPLPPLQIDQPQVPNLPPYANLSPTSVLPPIPPPSPYDTAPQQSLNPTQQQPPATQNTGSYNPFAAAAETAVNSYPANVPIDPITTNDQHGQNNIQLNTFTGAHPINQQFSNFDHSFDPDPYSLHQGYNSNHPGSSGSADKPPITGFKPEYTSETKMATTSPVRPASARRRPRTAKQAASNLEHYDTSRDLVFMRILSAQEFLAHMYETDQSIHHWSLCSETHLNHAQIKELLGLRGHLQDEVLRIQAMLAEDDPELESLAPFEEDFPHVIQRLRELHQQSRRIHIQSIDIGMDTSDLIGTQTSGTTSGTGINSGTQSRGQGRGIAVGEDTDEATIDNQLKKKFVAEEDHVTEDFTSRIVHGGQQMSQADLDRLLNDHAISMQALRKKQNLERQKYKELLEAKKQERLLKRRAANQESQGQKSAGSSKIQQPKNKSGDFFFIDFPNKKDIKKTGQGAKGPQSSWFFIDMDGKTSQENSSHKGQGQGHNQSTSITHADANTQSHPPVTKTVSVGSHSDSTTASVGVQGDSKSQSTGTDPASNIEDKTSDAGSDLDEDYEEDYEDDFEEDEAEGESDDSEEKAELKTTLQDDLWTSLRQQDGGTTKHMFQELLGVYRDQEEGRKNMKDAQKLKHKSSFLAKLAERQEKRGNHGDEDATSTSSIQSDQEVEDPYEKELEDIKEIDNDLMKKLLAKRKQLTDEEYQELLKRHLADVERLRRKRASDRENLDAKLREKLQLKEGQKAGDGQDPADEKLERELTKLDEKLREDLRKRGKNLDESDMEELLEHYRRQQEALLRQRRAEKQRTDEKLKRKLEEQKRKKKKYQEAENSDKPPDGADDTFFQELQRLQESGALSEEMFSRMLQKYLERLDQGKREKKRYQLLQEREKRAELDRDAASTLVLASQEQTKHIQGIRQREKDIMDQRLQKKLMAKQKQKETSQ